MPLLEVQERSFNSIGEVTYGVWSGEVVVFCPGCKALQTVWFNGDKLMPTRKFFQAGNNVYHDCGSSQPCRLHHCW